MYAKTKEEFIGRIQSDVFTNSGNDLIESL